MHATINELDPDHTCGRPVCTMLWRHVLARHRGQGGDQWREGPGQGPGMEMLIALSPPLVDTGNPI